MLRILFVVIVILSYSKDISSQEESKSLRGIYVSLNAGAYQGSKNHAGYYDGRSGNENNLDYVFSNTYWNNDIKNELLEEVGTDQFWIAEYPMEMHYNMALYAGFSARYYFSDAFALNLHFNASKLRLADAFNLEIDPPLAGQVRTYIPCAITGEELRSNIDLSMQFFFSERDENPWDPFCELGFNINSVNVRSSSIQIFDLTYSLRDVYGGVGYVPGQTLTEYPIKQGGIGYGLYSSAGITYRMSASFSAEFCFNIYYSTIALKGYEGFGLHYAPMVRFVVNPVVW